MNKLRINADAASLFALDNDITGSVNASVIAPGSGQQYQGNVLYKTDQAFFSGAFMHQQRDERESGNNIVIPNSYYQRNGGKFRLGYEWGKHQFDASYQRLNTNESGTHIRIEQFANVGNRLLQETLTCAPHFIRALALCTEFHPYPWGALSALVLVSVL